MYDQWGTEWGTHGYPRRGAWGEVATEREGWDSLLGLMPQTWISEQKWMDGKILFSKCCRCALK